MTTKAKRQITRVRRGNKTGETTGPARGRWLLRDAKARFSELVRRARTEGPQHVTVYGREEVVVVAAEDFRRLKSDLTGQALIDVMQRAALEDVDIEPARAPMPIRDVEL